jgi:apolipoprotein N-acyltransferase
MSLAPHEPQAAPRELAPLPRAARLASALGLLWLAGPGVLARDGNPALAVVALALWAAGAARPGRRAVLVEWALLALFFAAQIWWIGYVLALVVPLSGVVMAAWAVTGGVVLRRLVARGVPFALALPLAWSTGEGLQHALPIPFSWGWMRVGHLAAGEAWLVGSARVWGAVGLSIVLAGLAGALLDLVQRRWRAGLVGAALVSAATLAAALLTAPPPTVDGPTLLLVQPAIPMERKQGASAQELLTTQLASTREALAERAANGLAQPDAVVWAETMLPLQILGPGVADAIAAGGARLAPWHGEPQDLLVWERIERDVVHGRVLRDLLPAGTGFLAGVERWVLHEGALRRTNVGALWQHGRELAVAPKTHLVIGGETSFGFDELDVVRDFADSMAGYVPDLLAGEETVALELVGPAGTFHLATTVCFDNAFVEPYTAPLRRGRVDAHVVLSNEAWYRRSYEFDQMMAFSKVAAASTGRAVVRATNSGVSALIGPDGVERARLEVDGEDREVRGTLAVVVPVPRRAPGADASAPDLDLAPPFARLPRWGVATLALAALAAGPLVALLLGRSRDSGRDHARRLG